MARLAVLVLAALLGAGCMGDDEAAPDDDPGLFMSRLVREIGANRYDEAWETLHPTHQQVAPRAEYVACEQRNPVVGSVSEVRVLSVRDAAVRVAGEREEAPGKAVRIRLTVRVPDVDEPDRVTETFHAVEVDDRWAWIFSQARYEAYRADRCP
jgi:hypothetical protein